MAKSPAILLLLALTGCAGSQRGAAAGAGSRCNRIAACRSACSGGNTDGCFRLASLLDRNPSRASIDAELPLLTRACDGGHARTCVARADLVSEPGASGAPPAGCDARERELSQRACDAGDGIGCLGLATRGPEGDESAHSLLMDRATTLLGAGCKADDPYACAYLSLLSRKDPQGPAILAHARTLLERGCRKDDAMACLTLSILVPEAESEPLRQRTCRLAPELGPCAELQQQQ